MFAPLPTPREMAAWDQRAAALGLPPILLMEHAGKTAMDLLLDLRGPVQGARIILLMGPGNNGGDAACAARHLLDQGAEVLVLHTRPLESYAGPAREHIAMARACGVPMLDQAGWKGPEAPPDILVDGLLGTGLGGPLRGPEAEWVPRINHLRDHYRSFVLALDIPSGLDGLTGKPSPVAVRADATATFAAAKPGLLMAGAAQFTGSLHVCDIAMPRRVMDDLPASGRVLLPQTLEHLPRPGLDWHKGTAGHVLVAGGSPGLSGAPHLAGQGALRAGAGLVTLAAPGPVLDEASLPPDIMTLNLGDVWNTHCIERLAERMPGMDAVVFGPGLGRDEAAFRVTEAFLALPDRPATVLDADALFVLAHKPELLRALRPEDILTPHPGEAARFLSPAENPHGAGAAVQDDRLKALHRLMALAPCVWVLKGAGTLIGRTGEPVSLCPLDAPNLAVGGSGDVLAGCLGGLLAQGLQPDLAACCGVYLHATAGRLLARTAPRRGNSASEIADALARVGSLPDNLPREPEGGPYFFPRLRQPDQTAWRP